MELFIDIKLFYGTRSELGTVHLILLGVRWGHLLILKLFLWYKIRVRYGPFDPVEWWWWGGGGGWAGLKD